MGWGFWTRVAHSPHALGVSVRVERLEVLAEVLSAWCDQSVWVLFALRGCGHILPPLVGLPNFPPRPLPPGAMVVFAKWSSDSKSKRFDCVY